MTYELHEMDCRLAMSMLMDADSIDAIVTDPPYGLSKEPNVEEVLRHWLNGDDYAHGGSGFMGKTWDSFVPGPAVWREAYRVLKPGGHLIAFFGTRTYDLGVMALRMAGFEIRDQLAWVFGSGFPKSHDVSKGIAKRRIEDVEPVRVVCRFIRQAMDDRSLNSRALTAFFDNCNARLIDHWAARDTDSQPSLPTAPQWDILVDLLGLAERDDFEFIAKEWARLNGRKGSHGERWSDAEIVGTIEQAPAGFGERRFNGDRTVRTLDDEAAQWQGWGTALKPAYEPIVLARKPIASTVAANVLQYGTGAINIDGCRVGDEVRFAAINSLAPCYGNSLGKPGTAEARRGTQSEPRPYVGRWPANLCHDGSPEVLAEFPITSSGKMKAGTIDRGKAAGTLGTFGGRATETDTPGDSGSAARFFYCAKASKSDRNEGLDDLPAGPSAASQFRPNHAEGAANGENGNPYGRWSPVKNTHATVKPSALRQWLVRLITPPGGTVLDPFTGSGTTGVACAREGFNFIGCEMTSEYIAIATRRIAHAYRSRGD